MFGSWNHADFLWSSPMSKDGTEAITVLPPCRRNKREVVGARMLSRWHCWCYLLPTGMFYIAKKGRNLAYLISSTIYLDYLLFGTEMQEKLCHGLNQPYFPKKLGLCLCLRVGNLFSPHWLDNSLPFLSLLHTGDAAEISDKKRSQYVERKARTPLFP